MSKRGVVNVDLNRWYNSEVPSFLLTKRLETGDEGAAFRAFHGFHINGMIAGGEDTWQMRILRAKERREKSYKPKNMHVYNSATPPVQFGRPMTAPA